MCVTSVPRRTDSVNAPGLDDESRARKDPSKPRSSSSVSASSPDTNGWNHLLEVISVQRATPTKISWFRGNSSSARFRPGTNRVRVEAVHTAATQQQQQQQHIQYCTHALVTLLCGLAVVNQWGFFFAHWNKIFTATHETYERTTRARCTRSTITTPFSSSKKTFRTAHFF